jgi:hypothetical protein
LWYLCSLTAQKPNKLNWLGRRLPEGLLVDAAWLERHGYSGSLRRHVKRLFFFYADRHAHRWLARIDRETIDLGSGKRVLVRDGKLEPNYQITLPAEFFDAGQ